jgi:hypothetical protein
MNSFDALPADRFVPLTVPLPPIQAALVQPAEKGCSEASCMKWQLKDRPYCEILVEKAVKL